MTAHADAQMSAATHLHLAKLDGSTLIERDSTFRSPPSSLAVI